MIATATALALALLASTDGGAPPASDATLATPPAAVATIGPARTPAYHPGEQMAFDVEFGGFKAGEARITVGARVGDLLPVSLEAKTTGIIGIIKLKQLLVSTLDVTSGLPRASQIDGAEPGYRHTDTAQFDRYSGIATVRERGKYDNTYKVEVPPGTVDFVALVFKLRTLPLEPGLTHQFPVLAGRIVNQVVASVEARETVATFRGPVQAIRVRVPTGFSGKFSEKSPSFVWFTDDDRRSVVRISADFAVGRGVAVLTGYQPGDGQ